ncbi:hypothetical protein MIMGU_mgv1a013015mg [Erythranthe guttata]|uniref:Mitochondrial import receptor subunit TOM20 n=1 Tax=Erythranthe guttata TaxID=4155 RepID=A0A022S2B8_ERYGU|nr:hypothetical protein MIMGU_mgv1a013015mg [Erythranthe guttata]
MDPKTQFAESIKTYKNKRGKRSFISVAENMDMGNDFDRLLFFEHARKTAEATYTKNPLDADNLTRWGGVLLELSQFQNGPESQNMVQDAIEKLEEALIVDPRKHDALWCLGNAYTSNGFITPDPDEARVFFDKSTHYFEQAYELEPQNELYKKSLEVAARAPELHAEVHKHGGLAEQAMAPGPSASTSTKSGKKSGNSDLKYDICGWVILAVGLFVWVGFAKSNMPPPPSI